MKASTRARAGLGSKEWVSAGAPVRRALLSPTIADLFQTLDVGLTVWEPGRWREVYDRPLTAQILKLELEHGVEADRASYNIRCLAEAGRSRRTVIAEHSGFTDLFVPVCTQRGAHAVLVTGPFATQRPTSEVVRERWRKLARREADLTDPEFLQYLTATLSTLVLEDQRPADFKRLLEALARLIAGEGALARSLSEIETLGPRLLEARLPERMWLLARALLDEKTGRAWASRNARPALERLGVKDLPERLLVGLFVDRSSERQDPVEDLLRREAFQRSVVELAQKRGDCAGKLGDHGITLLVPNRSSGERTRRYLFDLGEAAARIARQKFGLELHFGVSKDDASLVEQYPVALACAEAALSKGVRSVEAKAGAFSRQSLGQLRRALIELARKKPATLPAEFDRYIEAVAVRSLGRVDLAQAHLEAGFEVIVNAVHDAGTLEPRNLSTLSQGLERALQAAQDLQDLSRAYRRALGALIEAIVQPRRAHRGRSLRRAEEHIRQHYAERLTLAGVARIAGFAPTYFSELFRKTLGVTFEEFVIDLRLRRARQLLSGTTHSVRRVAELSGFNSPEYLARTFKRVTGETPLGHRERTRAEGEIPADPLFGQ